MVYSIPPSSSSQISSDTLVPLQASTTKALQKDYVSTFGELQTMYGFGGTAPTIPTVTKSPKQTKACAGNVSHIPPPALPEDGVAKATSAENTYIRPELKPSTGRSPQTPKQRRFWNRILS